MAMYRTRAGRRKEMRLEAEPVVTGYSYGSIHTAYSGSAYGLRGDVFQSATRVASLSTDSLTITASGLKRRLDYSATRGFPCTFGQNLAESYSMTPAYTETAGGSGGSPSSGDFYFQELTNTYLTHYFSVDCKGIDLFPGNSKMKAWTLGVPRFAATATIENVSTLIDYPVLGGVVLFIGAPSVWANYSAGQNINMFHHMTVPAVGTFTSTTTPSGSSGPNTANLTLMLDGQWRTRVFYILEPIDTQTIKDAIHDIGITYGIANAETAAAPDSVACCNAITDYLVSLGDLMTEGNTLTGLTPTTAGTLYGALAYTTIDFVENQLNGTGYADPWDPSFTERYATASGGTVSTPAGKNLPSDYYAGTPTQWITQPSY